MKSRNASKKAANSANVPGNQKNSLIQKSKSPAKKQAR